MIKLKLIVSIFFFVLGLYTAYLSYDLRKEYSYNTHFNEMLELEQKAPDGIAISLGLISSFSFLSATLLLASINKFKELE